MDKKEDIRGWASTTWGMTEKEVLGLWNEEARPIDPPVQYGDGRISTVGIETKDIGGRNCTVHFIFDEKAGLNEVLIKPTELKAYGSFEQFLELLEEKYGPPTERLSEDITEKVTWRLPTTTVELQKLEAAKLDMLTVTISYKRTITHDLSFL